jgi:hypothetical protein
MSQHLEALQRANTVRHGRAQLKRDIKAGEILVTEILSVEIPDWLMTMRVEELALTIPRFQRRLFQRAMFAADAGLGLAVGALTPRQRSILVDRIGEWELRRWDRARAAA